MKGFMTLYYGENAVDTISVEKARCVFELDDAEIEGLFSRRVNGHQELDVDTNLGRAVLVGVGVEDFLRYLGDRGLDEQGVGVEVEMGTQYNHGERCGYLFKHNGQREMKGGNKLK